MKTDVTRWANGELSEKLVSKETLNHPGLIELVSGLDVYEETPEAYRRAYEALGIDIVNRMPLTNAPEPTPAGETQPVPGRPYHRGHLGVYDTVMRYSYLCRTPDDVWELGKKIIFVADGNMDAFLPRLVDVGVDGLMFENPATSLDAVIEVFGGPSCFMIGGVDTAELTNGTPETILLSPNILTESDPAKITFETLPEGDIGLRTPTGGGRISEEQSIVALSDKSLYCVYRSVDGWPVCSYIRSRGELEGGQVDFGCWA